MTTTKRKHRPDESDEALYHRIRAMPAAITEAQVIEMEKALSEDRHGPARRAALAVLARPCEHLFAQMESDRAAAVALAAVRASIADYLAHLAGVAETMKAAELRLAIGLCVRDDMDAVIAEAGAAAQPEVRP